MTIQDIHDQLRAAAARFDGVTGATMTPDVRRAIFDAMLAVDGVASVGLHTDIDDGRVYASVELSGECLTVHIGSPVRRRIQEVSDRVDARRPVNPDAGTGTGGAVNRWRERACCDRDARIAEIDNRLAIVEAAIAALSTPTGTRNPFAAFAFKATDAAA